MIVKEIIDIIDNGEFIYVDPIDDVRKYSELLKEKLECSTLWVAEEEQADQIVYSIFSNEHELFVYDMSAEGLVKIFIV